MDRISGSPRSSVRSQKFKGTPRKSPRLPTWRECNLAPNQADSFLPERIQKEAAENPDMYPELWYDMPPSPSPSPSPLSRAKASLHEKTASRAAARASLRKIAAKSHAAIQRPPTPTPGPINGAKPYHRSPSRGPAWHSSSRSKPQRLLPTISERNSSGTPSAPQSEKPHGNDSSSGSSSSTPDSSSDSSSGILPIFQLNNSPCIFHTLECEQATELRHVCYGCAERIERTRNRSGCVWWWRFFWPVPFAAVVVIITIVAMSGGWPGHRREVREACKICNKG